MFNRNFENVFLCVLTLILFTVPTILERRLKIDIPNTLEIIILLFIYAAEILGEIQAFYVYIPNWDTMLHTMNGFLCAAIGFSLLDILNRNEKVKFSLSPLYLAIVAFCFSMTVGVLWEFFEAGMDYFFLLDMQKDTVVNSIGSVMLDPTGGNKVVLVQDIVDVIVVQADGTRTGAGPGRIPGYRPVGYHGGPGRQLYRCACLLGHWLLLCAQPRQGPLCQPLYPGHRPGQNTACRSGADRPDRRTPPCSWKALRARFDSAPALPERAFDNFCRRRAGLGLDFLQKYGILYFAVPTVCGRHSKMLE